MRIAPAEVEMPLNHIYEKENAAMEKKLRTDGAMKLVLCGCGRLHVTCGSVTLHFDREEFLLFADSINRLAAIVTQQPANLAPETRPDAHSEMCH